MSTTRYNYLGTSLAFPVVIDPFGKAATVSGLPNVAQALQRLLSTQKGSRFMLPEYGSRLQELAFEPNDPALEAQLSGAIFEAVDEWEQRVTLLNVTFKQSENKPEVLDCTLVYRILNSNNVESTVYPFYRELKF